jgi:hypothetical protein
MAKQLTRKGALTMGALTPYLSGKLAADAKIDIMPTLRAVTLKTWATDKPKIKAALDAACKGKLAADADLEDVIELLDKLDDVTDELDDMAPGEAAPVVAKAATDDDGEMLDRLSGVLKAQGLSDDQVAAVMAAMKPEVDAGPAKPVAQDDKDKDKPVGITKAAMDAAIKVASDAAAKSAEGTTIARLQAVRQAERDAQPFLGALDAAPDTAAAIYKLALDAAGVDVTDVPPAAYGALLRALPKPGEAKPANTARVALDAAGGKGLDDMFPNRNRLSA